MRLLPAELSQRSVAKVCARVQCTTSLLICNSFVVQHIGTASAYFHGQNSTNKRFHYAKDFPSHVHFPGYDDHRLW
jgi:hypothetical protein